MKVISCHFSCFALQNPIWTSKNRSHLIELLTQRDVIFRSWIMAGSNSKKFATKCQQKTTHQNTSPDKQFGFGIHPRSVNMEDDALPVSHPFSWHYPCSWRVSVVIFGFHLSCRPFFVWPSLYQLQCNFSIHSIVSQHKFLETFQAAEHRKEGLILWSLWCLSQAVGIQKKPGKL